MSAESMSLYQIRAVSEDCGGSTQWIWEQEDDLWGFIRLKSSNKILTATWKFDVKIVNWRWVLQLKDLNVEATRDRQRWRWVGDLLVSKAHKRSVLTVDENGQMMVAYKEADGTNQQWEMAPAEEQASKPSLKIPRGKHIYLSKVQYNNFTIRG